MTSWLTVSVPSIMPVTGLLNQSLNSLWLSKMCGIRKCSSDQSSIRLFCSGVPVSSSRRFELKLSSVCQRCERKFLMWCASSSTRYFHFLRRKAAWSWMTSLYEVMQMWKALVFDQPCKV